MCTSNGYRVVITGKGGVGKTTLTSCLAAHLSRNGVTVLAVVHFGKFPNQFVSYHLSACIYSNSAPEKPISCAGEFDFPVNTQ